MVFHWKTRKPGSSWAPKRIYTPQDERLEAQKWSFGRCFAFLIGSSWAVFFFVLWPLYTGRQTYAKLTQAYAVWKVAYAVVFCLELLTRVVTQGFFASRSEEVSFEATLLIVPEVASLPFILAFCGFISFHFGLLLLHLLLWGTYGWGSQLLTQDLRGGYAVLTQGELVASDKCIQMYCTVTRNCKATKSCSNPNPWCLKISYMRKSAYAGLLTQWFIIHGYAKCLRRLRNHVNFQVLRLRALFIVPFSS